MKEITSFKLERNEEVLWMHLSNGEVAEIKSVKISSLWLKSEMDAVD